MLVASLLLLGLGGGLLISGAALGNEELVLAAIVATLASGGLLAFGVALHRPLPRASLSPEPTWSGATTEPSGHDVDDAAGAAEVGAEVEQPADREHAEPPEDPLRWDDPRR